MACALTQGYSVSDCLGGNTGGAKEVYISERGSVLSFTVAAGVVTAVTKATGKRFWKYQQIRETSYAKETIESNNQNGTLFYNQEVGIVLNKMQSSTRNEIVLLAKNLLYMVVRDNNGKFWLYGYENGMQLNGGEFGTGTAMTDRNGYTLTFAGSEPEMALEVSAEVAAELETPGV